MSDELKQFYRELLSWINEGYPEHHTFKKGNALCATLYLWCRYNKYYQPSLHREQRDLIKKLNVDVDLICPFNQNHCEWETEIRNHLVYKNPKRLAFIEEHAK